jgi:hypothetical protein
MVDELISYSRSYKYIERAVLSLLGTLELNQTSHMIESSESFE